MNGHSLYIFLFLMALNGITCHKFIYSPDKRVFGENTMAARTIINVEKPQTQTVEAVKTLLAWKGHPTNELPTDVSLENGRMVLVLSNKKDAYYVVTAKECSCPAHNWHPGQRCKHQRKYFAEQATHKQSMADTLEQAERNLPRMPYQYQRMVKAAREAAEVDSDSIMPRTPFRPFIEDDGKPTGAAKEPSSIPLVDTLPDPTTRDVAYWSIQEDKAMWPAEA